MNRQTKQERAQSYTNKYSDRKRARLARERRESTLIGRSHKALRRVVVRTLERVSERVAPTPDPWESEDWMVM